MKIVFILALLLGLAFAQSRTRIAVISDTHLGSTWTQTPARIQIIRDLLLSFSFPNTTAHTVVLAGDLLENWLYKFDETPMTYVELLGKTNIYNANIAEIVNILKAIVANNVKLVYLPGNHDDLLTNADFLAVGLNLTFVTDAYIWGNTRIEHGHYYDLFNAPDPANVRPVGYYISRAVTTSGRSSTVTSLAAGLCQVFLGSASTVQALKHDSLGLVLPMLDNALGGGSSSVLLQKYNQYKDSIVKNGCYYSSVTSDTTLGKAMQKYKSLVGRMMNSKGESHVEHMIDASCFDFDYFVPKFNSDLVVLGHTHKPLVKTYSRGTSEVVYVNSGGFVDDLANPTYVVIETLNGAATYVRLMQFANGEWQLKQGATVNSYVRPPPETPASWKCPKNYYGTGDKCDCNCGAHDPDCDRPELTVEGCNRISYTTTSCSAGICKYVASKPPKWTCDNDKLFVPNVCNCGCGAFDPSCAFVYSKLSGCPVNAVGCSFEGTCVLNGTLAVPPSWTCPPDYYGSDDGCDCNCGAVDPDCTKSGATTCACDGNKTASASVAAPSLFALLVLIMFCLLV